MRALHDAPNLRKIRLNVFEYPTDAFLDAPGYSEFDTVFTSGFAPMLNVYTRTERRIMSEENFKLEITRQMVAAAMGPGMIAIGNGTPPPPPVPLLESMVASAISGSTLLLHCAGEAAASAAAAVDDDVKMSDTRRTLLVAGGEAVTNYNEFETLAVAGSLKPVFCYLKRHEWDDTVNAMLARPLPESLVEASFCMIMPLIPCTDFLQRLPNLKSLTMSWCRMGNAAFNALAPIIANRMPNLTTLVLSRNELSSASASAEAADLGTVVGPSLESIDLSFNYGIGGPGATSLFQHVISPGSLGTRLARIDLSNTRFRTSGLSFDGLDQWAVPNAHLIIPNRFTEDEVARIEACMPDGGVLELDGPRCCPRGEDVPLLCCHARAATRQMLLDCCNDEGRD